MIGEGYIPSPRTAEKRLAAKSAILVPNFMVKDDMQDAIEAKACLSVEVV